jgi:hypothetical protein
MFDNTRNRKETPSKSVEGDGKRNYAEAHMMMVVLEANRRINFSGFHNKHVESESYRITQNFALSIFITLIALQKPIIKKFAAMKQSIKLKLKS